MHLLCLTVTNVFAQGGLQGVDWRRIVGLGRSEKPTFSAPYKDLNVSVRRKMKDTRD